MRSQVPPLPCHSAAKTPPDGADDRGVLPGHGWPGLLRSAADCGADRRRPLYAAGSIRYRGLWRRERAASFGFAVCHCPCDQGASREAGRNWCVGHFLQSGRIWFRVARRIQRRTRLVRSHDGVRSDGDGGGAWGLHLNTTVSRWNLEDLPDLATLVGSMGVPLWDLFFLVPTGRALDADLPSAEVHESTFNWVYEISQSGGPRVKTTLGQPYRRVWLSRKLRDEGIDWREQTPEQLVSRWPGGAATNDGRGIFFISHLGSVYPSGFLPVLAGDVRRDDLVLLYRESPVFQSLRSSDELGGKCGLCPFRKVCGGCRARAFAMTGDYLAADPTCPFQPAGWDSRSESTVTAVWRSGSVARDDIGRRTADVRCVSAHPLGLAPRSKNPAHLVRRFACLLWGQFKGRPILRSHQIRCETLHWMSGQALISLPMRCYE